MSIGSQEDINLATKAVQDKLEFQFSLSKDYDLTDLANQTVSQGAAPQAEYKPLTFIPSLQMPIPHQIKEELNSFDGGVVTEMSKRHPIVYFGISNRLYVWDYMRRVQNSQKRSKQKDFHQFDNPR